MNADGPSGQRVPDEVADREVPLQRQMGTDEGKAAGDLHCEPTVSPGSQREAFGLLLGLSVRRSSADPSRLLGELFRHVSEVGWLSAVDRPGADEEEVSAAGETRELETSLRPAEDCSAGLLGTRLARRIESPMNQVFEAPRGEREVCHI